MSNQPKHQKQPMVPLSLLSGDWELQDIKNVLYLARVRSAYKWSWSAGAEYLYRELIRTLHLEHEEATLLEIAKNKPGRRKNAFLDSLICGLTDHGKTAKEIQKILADRGTNLSLEGVESYRKTRRRFPSRRR